MGHGVTLAATFAPPMETVSTSGTSRSDGAKRAFDVAAALVLLALTLPVFLIVMAAVRMTSGRGVFYRQERVGLGGRRFTMLKFRTMVAGADRLRDLLPNETDGPLFKIRDDPRVTPVGRVLRRTSLDELPQLLNVIRGDMSLVGPRPALPDEVAGFPPEAHVRHTVRPGLTGLWQISGRSDTSFADYLRCDLRYVEEASLRLDVAILLRTVPAVIRAKGSY